MNLFETVAQICNPKNLTPQTMSRYQSTIATWKIPGGEFGIDFTDDLGRDYRLEFFTDSVRDHYNTFGQMSELEQRELTDWERMPLGNLPECVKMYINASFMEWRELVKIEDGN